MSASVYFSVYLDGTANNKDTDGPDGTHTNVARLYELDAAAGSNLARNSRHKPEQYEPSRYHGQSEKIYIDGVGSQEGNSPIALIERGTGRGGQSRIDQAYEAYVDFCNKNADQAVELNLIGFSRGAAQARALANEVIDRGVPKLDSHGEPTSEYLVPPGQGKVNKLAIFDTVASYGNPKTDSHPSKNLAISKNVESTTHLVAMHEYRDTFPLTSALRNDDNSRIEELKFAGAHSQVGGGYRNDVLAVAPLAFMHKRLTEAGLDMRPLPAQELKRIEAFNNLIKDPEQLRLALIDSRLFEGNEAFKLNPDGSYTMVDNSPFPSEQGTFLPFRRQAYPFAQEVEGRRVIFENDGSLGEPLLQRIGRGLGQRFAGWIDKIEIESALPGQPLGESYDEDLVKVGQGYDALMAAQSQEQVAELSSMLTNSRPDVAYLQSLNIQEVPMPQPGSSANYAVVRIDPEGSAAFADLGFEYEASRIVGEAAGAVAKGLQGLDDPVMLHDTNGNVVGSLETMREAPSLVDARGVVVAFDMQQVQPAAQAAFLHDGLTQAASWIAEQPEGTLNASYEIPGPDGKPLAQAVIAYPAVRELERGAVWDAPAP